MLISLYVYISGASIAIFEDLEYEKYADEMFS